MLLGHEILPSSLLSNTHVICEIRTSLDEIYTASLESENDHSTEIKARPNEDIENFKKTLASKVETVDSSGRACYDVARIRMPSDILKVRQPLIW